MSDETPQPDYPYFRRVIDMLRYATQLHGSGARHLRTEKALADEMVDLLAQLLSDPQRHAGNGRTQKRKAVPPPVAPTAEAWIHLARELNNLGRQPVEDINTGDDHVTYPANCVKMIWSAVIPDLTDSDFDVVVCNGERWCYLKQEAFDRHV